MSNTFYKLSLSIIVVITLYGCGPSREQLASLTAAAWTPMPSVTPTPTLIGGGTGQIAFVEDSLDGGSIFMMDADGTHPKQIASGLGFPSTISWSHDGQHMAFGAMHIGTGSLYIANADGSGMKAIATGGLAVIDNPSWSPDNKRIAFTENSDHIYIVNTDGTGLQLITQLGSSPTWSPDGSQLAFSTSRDGNAEIYVMYPDGSAQTNLSNDPDTALAPSWSPDGTTIAYIGCKEGTADYAIYLLDVDGGRKTKVADIGYVSDHFALRWSPDGRNLVTMCGNQICSVNLDTKDVVTLAKETDGLINGPAWQPILGVADTPAPTLAPIQSAVPTMTPTPLVLPARGKDGWIAFSSMRSATDQIYLMNPDGTDITRLTNNHAFEIEPSWSPDSEHIAFISTRDGNNEIYIMDANGSNQVRVTNTPHDDEWRPS